MRQTQQGQGSKEKRRHSGKVKNLLSQVAWDASEPQGPRWGHKRPTHPYTSKSQTSAPGPLSQPGEGQERQGCPCQGIPCMVRNGAPHKHRRGSSVALYHTCPRGDTPQEPLSGPRESPTILTSHPLFRPGMALEKLPNPQEEAGSLLWVRLPCSLLHPCSRSVGLAHSRCSTREPVQASTSNTR